eukprot:TRINITY_DN66941_c2_g6_i1.p2 TRINITY_DN66941_c2_g6~~TRINITY_DN66941_c2_g6_i1.p2  ORF type:complete len:101 (-),score=10.55 TRINITY_DN66941_c2_g6_i1:22-324(-)
MEANPQSMTLEDFKDVKNYVELSKQYPLPQFEPLKVVYDGLVVCELFDWEDEIDDDGTVLVGLVGDENLRCDRGTNKLSIAQYSNRGRLKPAGFDWHGLV